MSPLWLWMKILRFYPNPCKKPPLRQFSTIWLDILYYPFPKTDMIPNGNRFGLAIAFNSCHRYKLIFGEGVWTKQTEPPVIKVKARSAAMVKQRYEKNISLIKNKREWCLLAQYVRFLLFRMSTHLQVFAVPVGARINFPAPFFTHHPFVKILTNIEIIQYNIVFSLYRNTMKYCNYV